MDTDKEIYNCFIAKNKGEAGTIVSRTRLRMRGLANARTQVRPQERRDEASPHEADHDPENSGNHRGVGQEHHGLGVQCPTI